MQINVEKLRFAFSLAIAIALGIGLLLQNEILAFASAVSFFLKGIADLVRTYHAAKHYRASTLPVSEPTSMERIGKWIEELIFFTGLGLMCIADSKNINYRDVAGMIIWGGTILFHFASGIIFSEVSGAPMYMDWGSSRFGSRKNRNRRRS